MALPPPNERFERITELIAVQTGQPKTEVTRVRVATGGSIHRTEVVALADGRKFFVKSHRNASVAFAEEARGLVALAAAGKVRVPAVVASGSLGVNEDCLIIEHIEANEPCHHFHALLGHGLAEIHRSSTANEFGWDADNYLGSTLQRNTLKSSWIEFFAECRLRPQLRLARDSGLGCNELFIRTERVMDRLDQLLAGSAQRASLLHGDLWSGNYLPDENGMPVIFDPAVYYGDREADLAMPLLFGGFPAQFFRAYHEAWPLATEWQERVELYKLYHLLNHLNLFGAGYLMNCLDIVRKFV